MDVLILAGGKGTRLRPYTHAFPKALVPIGDMPVLELLLRQLKHYGFTEIGLAVGHLAELIKAYFGDGSKWGVRLYYLLEDKPLGTAGPLRNAAPQLSEHVLVMNGDLVCDIDFRALLEQHQQNYQSKGTLATAALQQRTTQIEFGVVDFDPHSQAVQTFREKPTLTHYVSMGINVFHRSVCEHIPQNQFFGLDQLMAALQENNASIQAFPFDGYWLDIGRHGDYQVALGEFETLRHRLLPDEANTTAAMETTNTPKGKAKAAKVIAGRWLSTSKKEA